MKSTKNRPFRYWMVGFSMLAVSLGGAAWADTGASRKSPTAASAIGSAKGLSKAFRFAADKVLPSVVAIENRPASDGVSVQQDSVPRGENPLKGTPFEHLFPDSREGLRRRNGRSGGLGSGVIVHDSGLVITNHHVVSGGGNVTVRLADGREFKALEVWTDPKTDIAVVKIAATDGLVAATIGNSDVMEIGDWVLALGQPFGLESTVTAGIISAKHRGIGMMARENFLQTDAAINPGNSGGPLVNLDGEVVGINTAISSRSGGNNGVGFAVPINLAKWVAKQLASDGMVRCAYLGVGIQPVTAQLASQFQVKPREGVVVTDVFPDTPAAKAGLRSGDVIVEFAGNRIASPQSLQVVVERCQLGSSHPMTIVRQGARMELAFLSEEQPDTFGTDGDAAQENSATPQTSRLQGLGLEISPLDPEVAAELGMKGTRGVVITAVNDQSPAARAGLASGMVITEINRSPVTDVADAVAALGDESIAESVLLLVRTANGSRFVALRS